MSMFKSYVDEKEKATMYSLKLSPEQKQVLSGLNSKAYSLKEDYIDFTKKYYAWNEKDTNMNLLELQNRKYYIALAGLCLTPLRNGINKRAVATSVGMYAVLAIMNPAMSKEIPRLVKQSLYPHFDKMSEMFPNSRFAAKLQQQKQDILIDKNHGRLPFTPETAALYRLAFIEKVYDDIRKNPDDQANATEGYTAALATLDELCKKDGVSQRDVSQHMSGIISMRIQNDPNYSRYFSEFNAPDGSSPKAFVNGDVSEETGEIKIHPKKDENGQNIYMTSADGREYMGSFSPREMYTTKSYKTQVYGLCKEYVDSLDDAKNLVNYNKFNPRFELQQKQLQDMFLDDSGITHYGEDVDDTVFKTYSDMAARVCVLEWMLDDEKGTSNDIHSQEKAKVSQSLAEAFREQYKKAGPMSGLDVKDIKDDDYKGWLNVALDSAKTQFNQQANPNERATGKQQSQANTSQNTKEKASYKNDSKGTRRSTSYSSPTDKQDEEYNDTYNSTEMG